MFKKIPKSRKEKIKTIKVITELSEHRCTSDCFKSHNKQPQGLKKVDLGYIHQDNEGRFYTQFEDGEWLEVTGVTFLEGRGGGLQLMFEPKEQLHFHSSGGRTVAETTIQKSFRGDKKYYADETI